MVEEVATISTGVGIGQVVSSIEIDYHGPSFDTWSLAELQTELSRLFNSVNLSTQHYFRRTISIKKPQRFLSKSRSKHVFWERLWNRGEELRRWPRKRTLGQEPLKLTVVSRLGFSPVRYEVREIHTGSLHEVVNFVVAATADANTRAILQNLAANVIWAVAATGYRCVRHIAGTVPNPDGQGKIARAAASEHVRALMNTLAKCSSGRGAELRLRHVRFGPYENLEVILKLEGDEQS